MDETSPFSTEDLGLQRLAVIAPAGFGKTEFIASIVVDDGGFPLVLTHTNAGVSVLRKRVASKSAGKRLPNRISTIAGWCETWVTAYPNVSGYSDFCEEKAERQDTYYRHLYEAMLKLLKTPWTRRSLRSTYSRLIVDEYQDCTNLQHEIILAVSEFLPVLVLGDPMQGIFYWVKGDSPIRWDAIAMPLRTLDGKPWRWINSGHQRLGEYISSIRMGLLPTLSGSDVTIDLSTPCRDVTLVRSEDLQKWKPSGTCSVAYLTTVKGIQYGFSQSHWGFQSNEPVDGQEAESFCAMVDTLEGVSLALSVIDFLKMCFTNVKKELSSFIKHLEKGDFDFRGIRKKRTVGDAIGLLENESSPETVLRLLREVHKDSSTFRLHRGVLFWEVCRALERASNDGVAVKEALQSMRSWGRAHEDYMRYKAISSRTVLSKGLEYDVAVVDVMRMKDPRDFYVAISRCKKRLVLVTDTSTITFKGLKG